MIQNRNLLLVVCAGLVIAACGDDDVPPTATIMRRLTAMLSPANETPPVTGVNSSGESRITVRTERNLTTGALDTSSVLVETIVANIDSVTAAHIHAGAAGVAGPIMVFLTPTYALVGGQRVARTPPTNATTLNGALSFVAITRTSAFTAPFTYDSLLARINAGTAYVNVHTRKNPAGEIRGQIQ
jgi:hypothetical protein